MCAPVNNSCIKFYEFSSTENCGICLETMRDTDTVAHTGLGNLHPVHRACLKEWTNINNSCPVCRAPIEVGFLDALAKVAPGILERIKAVAGVATVMTLGVVAAVAVETVAHIKI